MKNYTNRVTVVAVLSILAVVGFMWSAGKYFRSELPIVYATLFALLVSAITTLQLFNLLWKLYKLQDKCAELAQDNTRLATKNEDLTRIISTRNLENTGPRMNLPPGFLP